MQNYETKGMQKQEKKVRETRLAIITQHV